MSLTTNLYLEPPLINLKISFILFLIKFSHYHPGLMKVLLPLDVWWVPGDNAMHVEI